MSATLKFLRALSDPTRLRIVALLDKDELSVNELQEITRMGQSRTSTHLGLLQDSGLVQSRRDGKRTFYKLSPPVDGVAGGVIPTATPIGPSRAPPRIWAYCRIPAWCSPGGTASAPSTSSARRWTAWRANSSNWRFAARGNCPNRRAIKST